VLLTGPLEYAKEAVILEALKKVADNDRRMQTLNLSGAVNFQPKVRWWYLDA
jgi:hypothetical protein